MARDCPREMGVRIYFYTGFTSIIFSKIVKQSVFSTLN